MTRLASLAGRNPESNPSPTALWGWRAISDYMGVPISTLKVWREQYGFPVNTFGRRPNGMRVMALPVAIAMWSMAYSRAQVEKRRNKRSALAVARDGQEPTA